MLICGELLARTAKKQGNKSTTKRIKNLFFIISYNIKLKKMCQTIVISIGISATFTLSIKTLTV